MGLTVNSNLITPTNGEADATTGWTGTDTPAQQTTFYREATACLGYGTSESDDDSYITISSTNFGSPPGKTLFGWMLIGVPGSPEAIGFGLLLGDGTNDRVFGVGGNTNYGHFVSGWSGFRLDGELTGSPFRTPRGGSPDLTAVTRIGYGWNYPIAALGKVDTCFHDVIRYIQNGDAALTITGGSPGDPGTWADIVADDASTATGKAYGVCRLLITGSKAYELTYGIEFGSPSASAYFSDSDFQLVIVGDNMTAGNMDVDLIAGSGTDYFSMEDGVIVGLGTVSNWDMSAAFDTFQFNRMTCTDLGTIIFPASGGTLREVVDSTFNNCGQVTLGNSLTFTGNTFNGTTDANGALLIDDVLDDTNMEGLTFTSDGTGHAIYITQGGTYTFDGFTFTGYGATGSTDAAIYNNSGSPVTINIVNGTSPTYRNGTGATTTISQSATLTITGVWHESEIRIYETGTITEVAGIENSGSPALNQYATDGSFSAGNDRFDSTAYSFVSSDVGNQIQLQSGALSGNIYKIESVGSPGSPVAFVTPNFTATEASITWDRIDPTFDYTYNTATATNVDIVVHNVNYEYYRLDNLSLSSTNSSLPVVQRFDRNYNNP